MIAAASVTPQPPATILGEGPYWSHAEQAIYWIDVVGKQILRHAPPYGPTEIRTLPFAPSALVPRADGTFLLITKKGLCSFDFDSGAVESIPVAGIDFSREVFNDAACDPQGRLWIGTRDAKVSQPVGCLYRLEPDLTLNRIAEGYTVSNGIAFTPDARLMYHADSRPGAIYVYDYDIDTGRIGARRTFLDYETSSHTQGHPDGCTVDAEGGLWVAEVEGWRVARYGLDGGLDRVISTPFKKPTSVAFGGPDLRTLFITSMQFGLSETELVEQDQAGRLLICETDVTGRPEPVFHETLPASGAPGETQT